MSSTMTELPADFDASPPWLTSQSSAFTAPPAVTFNAPPLTPAPPATVPPALGSAWTLGAPPPPTPSQQPTPPPPSPVASPPPMAPLPVPVPVPVMPIAPPLEPPSAFVLASSNAAANHDGVRPRAQSGPFWRRPRPRARLWRSRSSSCSGSIRPRPIRFRRSPPWRAILDILAPKPPAVRYDDEAPPPENPRTCKGSPGRLQHPHRGAAHRARWPRRRARSRGGPDGRVPPAARAARGRALVPVRRDRDAEGHRRRRCAARCRRQEDQRDRRHGERALQDPMARRIHWGRRGPERACARGLFAQRAALPAGYLDAHTERRLLEQRRYQRRTLLGRTWIRAL